MKKLTYFLLLNTCFLLMISCGKDTNDSNNTPTTTTPPPPPQEEQAQDFSTRLESNLAFSGTECDGEETTEYEGETFTCERDQWLITVDNVNTCNGDACTEVAVSPIIARLARRNIVSAPEYSFYRIVPISPVNTRQFQDIKRVWVRTDMNGDTEVVYR